MSDLVVRAVDRAAFEDLRRLFEGHGNPCYCWCMLRRAPTAVYRGTDGSGRRAMLRDRIRRTARYGVASWSRRPDTERAVWLRAERLLR